MLTSDYFNQWLADMKPDLAKSTYEAYTVYFGRHIIPYFDEHCPNLEDIKPRTIKDYTNYIKSSGRLDGKSGGLGTASVRKHLALIKQALNDAVVYEYIPTNPAAYVKLRRSQKPVSDKTVMLNAKEAQQVIDACYGHPVYPAVVLALTYGLRRSEVCGLRWSSVDLEKNEMRIEHTVVKNLTIDEKDTTKTELSKATYELLPDIRDMLEELKRQKPKSEYVVTWDDGRPIRPDSLTKSFQRQLKSHDLPRMRFHDLRHSAASVLFDEGKSLEEVKDWLRHSDIETTSNIYLHYGRDRRKLTMKNINGIYNI
ncbi:MAG: site-specific integrase [Oscillospiraceae bacterium]|nr:site-specific integrase [Oscillospiraceae bacterium]